MTSPQHTVTLHEGVSDRLREALQQIQVQAQQVDTSESYEELSRKLREVVEKQGSLLRGLVSVVGSTKHDGDVDVFVDGETSLFFRCTSGYHGGLLNHGDRWAVHT